ncbi:hypothetical protein LU276_09775 [Moraxella haemolytica]|uniref:hypothetical protein n=1 Tax=Moraxella haemolytica TaxID=2904119 RepID=UPI0025427C31|nr:hypothetical protein [Moraxella sp. ZY171148]WII95265.1 hypothetical protein LU276_09775 [Moraxella sp. ZY171148]
MKFRIPYHFIKHKKDRIVMRHLTTGEITLAQSVFGDLIDYDKVKIIKYPYIPWQSDEVFIAPNGFIFVPDKHYKADFSVADKPYQQIFIHEMTHVLQHQYGYHVLLRGAWLQSLYYLSFKKYNPYHYVFDESKSFWDYNIEQQGKIAEHIYLGKCENIIHKA